MLLRQMMVLICWMMSGAVIADCVGVSAAAVQQHFSHGEQKAAAGKLRNALDSYVLAQAYVCDGNKLEHTAATRAAAIAKQLAPNLEKTGKLQEAFEVYEAGGYFKEADRVMLAMLEMNPDDYDLYAQALEHFNNHQQPAFQTNNRVRIAVTGDYHADNAIYNKLLQIPVAAVERLLKRESDALPDAFLRDREQLDVKIGAAATNPALLMQLQQEDARLRARWGNDRFADSLHILGDARTWANRNPDQAQQQRGLGNVNARMIQRGDQLVKSYSAAPALLEQAMNYYIDAQAQDRVANLKTTSHKLGETAMQKQHYMVAAIYLDLAEETEQSDEARAMHDKMGMKNFDMDNYMQQMSQQAQLLQNSPEQMKQIQALQQQMEEMMKNGNIQN
jgi:hypothetical protein